VPRRDASAPDDLTLHGVRVLGFPTASPVAARYGLDAGTVGETLLDFEATGWVRHLSFGGASGMGADGRRPHRERKTARLYTAALSKAQAGQRDWVDGHDRDSCHTVWIQFHEDLLATLGIPPGTDA
jgi:hypothetical protein